MGALISQTVQFIAHHSEWTFAVMFVTAFGESFVFLSLLFPGTTIMIAAGLLVPSGTLHLVPLLAGAILGAVLGDSVSYWLGLRFGTAIKSSWPLSKPSLRSTATRFLRIETTWPPAITPANSSNLPAVPTVRL